MRRASICSGFTLIELVVGLSVIGILASVAVLSVAWVAGDRPLRDEAERLQRTLARASDTAVLDGRRVALQFTASGYRLVQRRAGDWVGFPAAWDGYGNHDLAAGIRLSIADGQGSWDEAPARALTFDPEGLADAALLRLLDKRSGGEARLHVSPMAAITLRYRSSGEGA